MGKGTLLASALLALTFLLPACGPSPSEQDKAPAGNAQLARNFSEEAAMLEAAVKEDPNNLQLLIKLGNLYFDWGQEIEMTTRNMGEAYDKRIKGIEYYSRSLAIDPTNVNVRVDMGTLLRATSQPDRAIAEYRAAIAQDPRHPQARINYIISLGRDKQEYAAAVREYEELLKVAPEQMQNADLRKEIDDYRRLAAEGKK